MTCGSGNDSWSCCLLVGTGRIDGLLVCCDVRGLPPGEASGVLLVELAAFFLSALSLLPRVKSRFMPFMKPGAILDNRKGKVSGNKLKHQVVQLL